MPASAFVLSLHHAAPGGVDKACPASVPWVRRSCPHPRPESTALPAASGPSHPVSPNWPGLPGRAKPPLATQRPPTVALTSTAPVPTQRPTLTQPPAPTQMPLPSPTSAVPLPSGLPAHLGKDLPTIAEPLGPGNAGALSLVGLWGLGSPQDLAWSADGRPCRHGPSRGSGTSSVRCSC